jgi:hypothetical protein
MTGTIERDHVGSAAAALVGGREGEKAAIVQETYAPGMSVSLVARSASLDASPAVDHPQEPFPVRSFRGNYTLTYTP